MYWFFCFFSAIFSYLFIDKDLAIYLNSHVFFLNLFKLFSFLIAPLNHLILWGLLTMLSIHSLYKNSFKPVFTLLLTVLTYMFIAGILKIVIGRARPQFFIETGFYGFSFLDGYHSYFRSFPSSHSATAFALAYFFAKAKKPHLKKVIYLIATLLVSSRLFLKEHYLSDLILGGMIGVFSARIVLNKIEQAITLARLIVKRL
jgi:membrane-associated phospholipid phosphatase